MKINPFYGSIWATPKFFIENSIDLRIENSNEDSNFLIWEIGHLTKEPINNLSNIIWDSVWNSIDSLNEN